MRLKEALGQSDREECQARLIKHSKDCWTRQRSCQQLGACVKPHLQVHPCAEGGQHHGRAGAWRGGAALRVCAGLGILHSFCIFTHFLLIFTHTCHGGVHLHGHGRWKQPELLGVVVG